MWYKKGGAKKSDLCDKSAMQKFQHQEATSTYAFENLSPKSKKVKLETLRKVVSSLHGHGRTSDKEIKRMSLSDIQNEKIS